MARQAKGRTPDPASAAPSSDNDVAKHSVTNAPAQSLRAVHVELLRRRLAASRYSCRPGEHINAIELTLRFEERHEWAIRGLTLKQRDEAAALLVQWGEARYALMVPQSFSARGEVLHLVAVQGVGQ